METRLGQHPLARKYPSLEGKREELRRIELDLLGLADGLSEHQRDEKAFDAFHDSANAFFDYHPPQERLRA